MAIEIRVGNALRMCINIRYKTQKEKDLSPDTLRRIPVTRTIFATFVEVSCPCMWDLVFRHCCLDHYWDAGDVFGGW